MESACNENKLKKLKPKLQYTFIGDKLGAVDPHVLLDANTSLKPYETISYEFRESLCPNSNLTKIQVTRIKDINGGDFVYDFTQYTRLNSGWMGMTYGGTKPNTKACKTYNFGVTYDHVYLYCDDVRNFFISYGRYDFKANYFVKGIKHQLNCP